MLENSFDGEDEMYYFTDLVCKIETSYMPFEDSREQLGVFKARNFFIFPVLKKLPRLHNQSPCSQINTQKRSLFKAISFLHVQNPCLHSNFWKKFCVKWRDQRMVKPPGNANDLWKVFFWKKASFPFLGVPFGTFDENESIFRV